MDVTGRSSWIEPASRSTTQYPQISTIIPNFNSLKMSANVSRLLLYTSQTSSHKRTAVRRATAKGRSGDLLRVHARSFARMLAGRDVLSSRDGD